MMIREDNLVVSTEIDNLDFYYSLPEDTIVYIRDLPHQAFKLIKEAQEKNVKLYKGNVGNTSKKTKWLKHMTYGLKSPTTINIKLSNGVVIRNYSLFDADTEATEEDMMAVAKELASYGSYNTGGKLISSMIESRSIADIPNSRGLSDLEEEYYYMLLESFRGGASAVLHKDKILYETHIDYHQMYASVMLTHRFPKLEPLVKDGYVEDEEFAIYEIAGGTAILKPDGYPLLAYRSAQIDESGNFAESAFGADYQEHELSELECICKPDLETLYDNYYVYNLEIERTLYYPCSFSGEDEFGELIKLIYEKRHTTTGSVKRLYKLMNEYCAGYFEKNVRKGNGWWQALDAPTDFTKPTDTFNPKVGIFITAYGRRKLNELLHMFNRMDIAGYDTDCAFFRRGVNRVPAKVKERFGDGIGQLHYDGIYKDVIHVAPKHYYGFDIEANAPFEKASGVSKSGKRWRWDRYKKEYLLEDVK